MTPDAPQTSSQQGGGLCCGRALTASHRTHTGVGRQASSSPSASRVNPGLSTQLCLAPGASDLYICDLYHCRTRSLRGIPGSRQAFATAGVAHAHRLHHARGARSLMGNVVPGRQLPWSRGSRIYFPSKDEGRGTGVGDGGRAAAMAWTPPLGRASPSHRDLPSRNGCEPMSQARPRAPATHQGEGGPGGLQLPLAHSPDSGPD